MKCLSVLVITGSHTNTLSSEPARVSVHETANAADADGSHGSASSASYAAVTVAN